MNYAGNRLDFRYRKGPMMTIMALQHTGKAGKEENVVRTAPVLRNRIRRSRL